MSRDRQADLEDTIRKLRNILPYLKDWNPWQKEILRLERNIVKLRKNRYPKLARTLEQSLSMLKTVLDEVKTEHAFTVNQLVAKLDKLDRRHKELQRRTLRT
jgi:hypothetical protein